MAVERGGTLLRNNAGQPLSLLQNHPCAPPPHQIGSGEIPNQLGQAPTCCCSKLLLLSSAGLLLLSSTVLLVFLVLPLLSPSYSAALILDVDDPRRDGQRQHLPTSSSNCSVARTAPALVVRATAASTLPAKAPPRQPRHRLGVSVVESGSELFFHTELRCLIQMQMVCSAMQGSSW